jgi:nicotinamidase-related amidase
MDQEMKRALILVDIQNDFVPGGFVFMPSEARHLR